MGPLKNAKAHRYLFIILVKYGKNVLKNLSKKSGIVNSTFLESTLCKICIHNQNKTQTVLAWKYLNYFIQNRFGLLLFMHIFVYTQQQYM